MFERREILLMLRNKERVAVTPENYLARLKLFLIVFGLVCFLLLVTLLSIKSPSSVILLVCFTIILTCGAVFAYIIKKLNSAFIKGDSLIINSLNRPSKVTSLRSIRKVNTKSILGISMTKINYSLDGRKNTVRFVGRSRALPIKPNVILNNAIQKSKKRKANHKPGPVTVN